MNRRNICKFMAASGMTGLTSVVSRDSKSWALEATPTPSGEDLSCNLDLDASDLTWQLAFPDDMDQAGKDEIAVSLSARLHALGWSACSVSPSKDRILVNVQTPSSDDDIDLDLVSTHLTAAGRVDIVDGGESLLEPGDHITTSTTPLPENGPDVNVVYEAILTNADFVSVERQLDSFGQPIALITVTDSAGERLSAFTRENIGSSLPLVIDGDVVIAPTIQAEIGTEFELQPVEPFLVDQLRIFTSAPAYPVGLTIASFHDNRATPTA